MTSTPDLDAWTAARKRGLRIHAVLFFIMMPILTAIDLYTAEPYWAHWVALGWGLGLAGHAMLVGSRAKSVTA